MSSLDDRVHWGPPMGVDDWGFHRLVSLLPIQLDRFLVRFDSFQVVASTTNGNDEATPELEVSPPFQN